MANTVITKSMTSGDIGATYDTVLKKLTSMEFSNPILKIFIIWTR